MVTTKYRVWWKPQVPMESFTVEVPDVQTGRLVEEILANYDQFQYENNIKPDYCNAGGVQYWDEELQEWCEMFRQEKMTQPTGPDTPGNPRPGPWVDDTDR